MNDLLIKNCRLLGENSSVDIHIKDGLIHNIESFIKPSNLTQMIDAEDNTVLPGLDDSHLHLLSLSLNKRLINVRGELSKEKLMSICNDARPNYGGWIVAKGYDENKFTSNFTLDRNFLDEHCGSSPAIFYRVCGHVAVLNTKALEALNIDSNTTVFGGELLKDTLGELTGVITEKALNLVKLPQLQEADLVEILTEGIRYVKSMGITSVQTDDLSVAQDYKSLWSIYTKAIENEPLRVYLHYNANNVEDIISAAQIFKEIDDTTYIKKGSIKVFLDGSLGARTAALKEDYSDCPNYKGVLTYSDRELDEMVKVAVENGLQLALHAIGDKAMSQGIESIRKADSKTDLRHRIIHCQVTDNKIIGDMADLNIIAEIQPTFLITDMDWAESRLGKRIEGCYAFKTMLDEGIIVSGGSDCPVEPVNPFLGLYSAVTRKNLQENPKNGWLPDEKLDLTQAVEIYTQGSAYASFDEQRKGKIQKGFYADLVILDTDLEAIKPEKIKDVKVTKTLIAASIN
ncbi:amidohydrolase [Proteinivorax hydrogeniformans]|uniref:Amidohydrolase n=1 Tax=Proteinivorax hydrogeniformans TaxID=1826727 RepID=A0AAU8HPU5_9FIRM